MAIVHPIRREALARRHQRELRRDELLDPLVLPGVLTASDWNVDSMDDAGRIYLALLVETLAEP